MIAELIEKYGRDMILLILMPGLAYIFGSLERKTKQKKAEVDIQGGELRNLSETFAIYEKLLSNLEVKLEEANEDFAKLRVVNKQTMHLLQLCKKDKDELHEKNMELAKIIKTCDFGKCPTCELDFKIHTD